MRAVERDGLWFAYRETGPGDGTSALLLTALLRDHDRPAELLAEVVPFLATS